MENKSWEGFNGGKWENTIDVRDFIQKNYTEYKGGEEFLTGSTKRTKEIMRRVNSLFEMERQFGGVLDIDTETVSEITAYKTGYIDKDKEIIVGLQTNRPLKRGVNPFGGMRMARQACEAYGYTLSESIEKKFKYRTTHNDGVFSAYTDEMRLARRSHLITGLPDAYGRGRIIGDYRRVALYGIDFLIENKKSDKASLTGKDFNEETIRLSEELSLQIKALNDIKEMAKMY